MSPLVKTDDVFTIMVAGPTTDICQSAQSASVDGTAVGAPLTLVNGIASYTIAFSATGKHTVTAVYSGAGGSVGSSGSVTVTVPEQSFALTSSTLTVPQKGSGTASITVTPTGGYSGTIAFGISNSSLTNVCFSLPDVTVDGSGPTTANLHLSAGQPSCPVSVSSGALGETD